MRKFELVIPAYNEAASLERVIRRAVQAAKIHGFTSESFQLIVVNNGSTDESTTLLQTLKKSELGPYFSTVQITKNKGYGDGIWRGLQSTRSQIIGWTHADEQCDPDDAFVAYEKLLAMPQNSLVKGFRSGRTFGERAFTFVFETLSRILLQVRLTEINAQPKVFHRSLLDEIINPPQDFAFDLYVLFRAIKSGFHIETVPVIFPPRLVGESKWSHSLKSRFKTSSKVFRYLLTLRHDPMS